MEQEQPFQWTNANDSDFEQVVLQVKEAISQGIHPQRIGKGSSGSYFVKDCSGTIVGVFKPSDEEPYGKNNPKWCKWIQRICFPCIFGRSCLVPNSGYLCEAAASKVDQILRLKLVPLTKIVELSSTSFNYSSRLRKACQKQGKPLPSKSGSFQLFVSGFEDAKTFFAKGSFPLEIMNAASTEKKQNIHWLFEFQKLVILDYLIRNTDRGLDNWLLARGNAQQEAFSSSSSSSNERVKIAAIDNGLAFPHRHPSKCRSYPYSWAKSVFAREVFCEETKSLYLPLLWNMQIWDRLEGELREIFAVDSGFCENLFQHQMSVMRGQLMNLAVALETRTSPLELLQMPRIIIHKQILTSPSSSTGDHEDTGTLKRCKYRLKKIIIHSKPCFSCF